MKINSDDTIVAISTLIGEAGIGIVRLSGPDAISIASKIFQPKSKKLVKDFPTFKINLGKVTDNNNFIDEVLLMTMRAPKSYTCEDVVEISCHGGIVPLKKTLELCVKNGARLADPGEFTKRAFLNGRIDLSQAEAVCDIITVDAQASVATFVNNENADDFLNTALPAGTVAKLKIPDASVKKITQPYSSFGGRPKENDDHFYIRVSERLRHKARANESSANAGRSWAW